MSDETPKEAAETPETPTDSFPPVPAATTVAAPAAEHKPSKLNKVLAWVGIVAGTVFIVATIFFSGFILGAHCGGHHGWHKHHHGQGTSEYREGHGGQHHGMWNPGDGPGGSGWQGPGWQGPGWQGGPGNGGPGGPGEHGPGAPGPVQPGAPTQPGR
ncbi:MULTISPECIES: hypothetical protein [unclassified Mycolicibacterium]|uniref:hypothetical protein n=1 Tax=unclassified Mycolicibacterium TaxID=2636767 RepID=UPI0012DD7986|nr:MULTISPECIES: hypothetical protein [unclassified Mycolicibacterium]MUM06676.1 hypothetical protein [Mycolicibacterium sp. CBMA 213]